ncbi:hypothetical protein WH47_02858 [Habropoda laboriosa]|uniref:Uncharacterized protein n=1 Tax=Habropoda laboriosa TaxID=597456 RepID=A0A0L7RHM9_9HYME|nr:hypothetical protein WH47_02858 [Habropoda laboriosa]
MCLLMRYDIKCSKLLPSVSLQRLNLFEKVSTALRITSAGMARIASSTGNRRCSGVDHVNKWKTYISMELQT